MGIGLVPKWVPLSSLCDPLFICSSARWDGHGGGVDFGWRPSSQGPCLVALGRHHDFRLTFIVGSRSLCCLPSQRLRWGGKRWLHSVDWLSQPELCLGSGWTRAGAWLLGLTSLHSLPPSDSASSTPKTPDGGHSSQEIKSETSSNPSSPEICPNKEK